MSGPAVLLSLPGVLKRRVAAYCDADDVLQLVQTCSSVKRELELSILSPSFELIYGHMYSGDEPIKGTTDEFPVKEGERLPIVFFPELCHAVRLSVQWYDQGTSRCPGRLFVVSRPKVEGGSFVGTGRSKRNLHPIQSSEGNRGNIVWESPPTRNQSYTRNITFCPDSSEDYFLWYQCGGRGHFMLVEKVTAQWLVWEDESDTRHCKIRQRVYRKCISWDQEVEQEEDANRTSISGLSFSNEYERPALQFLAKLFRLALETMTITLSPESDEVAKPKNDTLEVSDALSYSIPNITKFLESADQGIGKKLDANLLLALKQVATVYLQLVERKDPNDSTVSSWNESMDMATINGVKSVEKHIVVCPPLLLQGDIGWGVPMQYEPVRGGISNAITNEIPQFVTRIPVTPETKRFRLTGGWEHSDSASVGSLVVFAKAPHGGEDAICSQSHINLWSKGDVILQNGCHLQMVERITDSTGNTDYTCDVSPDLEYFLYAVPNETSTAEIFHLELHLSVLDNEEESIKQVFERFLGRLNAQPKGEGYQSHFHLGLLRAVAATLLERRKQKLTGTKYNALSFLLESEGFMTDETGLECLIEVLESLLQYKTTVIIPAVDEGEDQSSLRPYMAM